jgi:L-alanine-DL-glutamate epimerase-like enolase superfamily enzyme
LLVALEHSDGTCGWGEAAPLPAYEGATADEIRGALDAYGRALASAHGPRAELLAACAATSPLPQALAAIDLALWDLEGRRRGLPVSKLIANDPRTTSEVEVNATVAAEEPEHVATGVAAARGAGFRCAKVKAGLGDDGARLAAARSAGGADMAIRIDANGAWSVGAAIAALEALAPLGIELCEEPVHGLDAIADVAMASPVPISVDETAATPGALERRICDAACLKIARCGGITGVLERAAEARAAGYRLYLASTFDGPLGIAAALHAAVAVRPDLPCGLATLASFGDRPDPLPPRRGRIAVPPGPGLGEGLAQWYE